MSRMDIDLLRCGLVHHSHQIHFGAASEEENLIKCEQGAIVISRRDEYSNACSCLEQYEADITFIQTIIDEQSKQYDRIEFKNTNAVKIDKYVNMK